MRRLHFTALCVAALGLLAPPAIAQGVDLQKQLQQAQPSAAPPEAAPPAAAPAPAPPPEAQPPAQPPQAQQDDGGERRGRRERSRDAAPAAPPQAAPAPQPSPPAAEGPRGERRNRRDAGGPPAAPPTAQPPTGTPGLPDVERLQERRGARRERDRTPEPAAQPAGPPQEAQPVQPPAATPTPSAREKGRNEERRGARRERDRTPEPPAQPAEPPQQAQPVQPPATTPTPSAREKGRDEERRGARRDRRDRQPAEAPPAAQPPQQAQPAPLPQQPLGTPPQPAVVIPPPPPPMPDARQQAGPAPATIQDLKRRRRERTEAGGKRTIIEEPGRTIVQDKGAPPVIRADETERMRRSARDVRSERRPDGGNVTIAVRPGGIEVFSEFDSSGRLTRRYRRDRDGRDLNIIDNRRFSRGGPVRIDLGPISLRMPRERYIVDYERASDDDIYDALTAGPIERLPRGYSLDEVRYNTYLRDRMRRVDLDTVTFDFGAWRVHPDQYNRLERIARAMHRALDRNPDEVFLVEGHTDAIGSEIDNLTLSDRRAEEVAVILTDTFGVPFENLVTQGYGEEFLKIPTLQAERANRRVAVRRITPLLARD